ncbi:MAG: hypothetical protein J7621_11825 [Niastella sp.]|nr:hypothetical protein [Niastella sp.]
MKRFLVSALFVLPFYKSRGQQVDTTSIVIDKVVQPAQTVRFEAKEAVVKDALTAMIKSNDGKSRKSGGFLIGKGVKMQELSDQRLTVYYKVERDRKNSIVTMAVQQPDGRFASDSTDATLQQKANIYLTSLQHRVLLQQKNQEIAELQESIGKLSKSMKKNKRAQEKDDAQKLKRMRELEQRLSDLNSN